MRTLIIALVCLFSAPHSFASPKTNEIALKIIESVKLKRAKMKANQALVKILVPESVRQGDTFSVYGQSATEITGTNSLISFEIEGQPVSVTQPAKGLFIHHSPGFGEIRTYNGVAKLSIEDAAESKSIRDAIKQLDIEILELTDLIDEMEEGSERDALIAQRQVKINIKNQLIAALESLKFPIGQEPFSFRVIAALNNNPNFFRITGVSPSFGPATGGTEVTVTGLRFPEGLVGVLGGIEVPVNRISQTEVKITSPNFTNQGGPGIKHLELKLPALNPDEQVKNAVRNNSFFAGDIPPPENINYKPVAVAGNAQSVMVGAEVFVNGSASYDPNPGTSLSYSWKAVSVPADSGINIGEEYSTNAEFSFIVNKPGSYVWELNVSDGALFSEPSLTVVTANPPENSAPVPSASGISLAPQATGTTQVSPGDQDNYQAHTFVISKQSSLGTATISSTGLLTFEAGESEGSDTIEVTVVDNGNPPLSGVVSIPVTVASSIVSIGFIGHEVVAKGGIFTTWLYSGISSSNGQIVSAIWNFGDGTTGRSVSIGPGTANDGFITHDFVADGTYTAILTATDSFGATATESPLRKQADLHKGIPAPAGGKKLQRLARLLLRVPRDLSKARCIAGEDRDSVMLVILRELEVRISRLHSPSWASFPIRAGSPRAVPRQLWI